MLTRSCMDCHENLKEKLSTRQQKDNSSRGRGHSRAAFFDITVEMNSSSCSAAKVTCYFIISCFLSVFLCCFSIILFLGNKFLAYCISRCQQKRTCVSIKALNFPCRPASHQVRKLSTAVGTSSQKPAIYCTLSNIKCNLVPQLLSWWGRV